jgi:hypothetical protein
MRSERVATRRIERTEEGSIALVVLVMMVASGLILALVSTSVIGLRSSRRAGDSANALQLADAGLNDAVRAVGATAQSSITSGPVSLGSAGSYSYTANLDPTASVWHVASTGADQTGVKRTVNADAVAESLFGSALFVQSSLSIPAGGTLDSFADGTSKQRMCTKHGVVGTNSGDQLAFNTSGTDNCQDWAYNNNWAYPVDGCISYADSNPPMPTTGAGKCPSSNTTLHTPAFSPPQVVSPGGSATAPIACSSSTSPLTAQANGAPYFWTSVTLRSGCKIDPSNGPVVIYTSGTVDIGDANGSSGTVNQPYAIAGMCGPSTYLAGLKDQNNNPSSYYCPGWSGNLRIYVLSGSSSTVILRNHVQFWGVIDAPTACLACVGASGNSGSPHSEVWGAIISGTSNSQAQISLHYDDALADLGTGRFTLKNWREEKS